MLGRVLLWISIAGVIFLLSDATYEFPCLQGEFLNTTVSGRQVCTKCPKNTYWAMQLDNGTMIGAMCMNCAPWLESAPGSPDISHCVCNSENCDRAAKGSSMGMIIGILITIIILGAIIASLFWCKTYGPELLKALTGRHVAEAEAEGGRGHEGYEKMLPESPSPNLLDCDIGITITDEQVEEAGYTNETAVGDHNDIQAVLRAAVISEKRRSRIVSMSSMTDLDRARTGSICSGSGRSLTGRGPPSRAGYNDKPGYSQGSELPLPNYADYAHTRKAQTAL